jgi:hypothetical protein
MKVADYQTFYFVIRVCLFKIDMFFDGEVGEIDAPFKYSRRVRCDVISVTDLGCNLGRSNVPRNEKSIFGGHLPTKTPYGAY